MHEVTAETCPRPLRVTAETQEETNELRNELRPKHVYR